MRWAGRPPGRPPFQPRSEPMVTRLGRSRSPVGRATGPCLSGWPSCRLQAPADPRAPPPRVERGAARRTGAPPRPGSRRGAHDLSLQFIALLVQALVKLQVRRAMATQGVKELPLYLEDRACCPRAERGSGSRASRSCLDHRRLPPVRPVGRIARSSVPAQRSAPGPVSSRAAPRVERPCRAEQLCPLTRLEG